MAERENAAHVSCELISCLMTPFIRGFQRDLLVMSCLSESQKTSVKLQRGLWSRQTASTSNVRNRCHFSPPSLKMRLRFVTALPALVLMDAASPPRAKTRAAVCIVTCTSGPGGCQVVCKGESFGDYEDKKFVLLLPQQEGEPLCQRSLKCTLNISSPIAGRDTTFSNGPNVCGDGFSQTTKQIFYHSPPEVPSKST